MNLNPYIAICLLATGCGATLPRSLLDEPEYRAPSADGFPDDSAVILLQREVFEQAFWPTELTHTTHQIVAVLRDEGLSRHGAFFIALTGDEKLLDFEATVRTSEGKTHTIGREALVERKVEKKSRDEDPDKPVELWELTELQGTIPGIDIGSVLELRYRTRGEYLRSQDIRAPEIDIPIKRFERDLFLPPQVRFDAEIINSDVPFEISRNSAGTHIRWVLDNLPADRDESWSADWHERKPWMLYRTKQVVSGLLHTRTWNTSMTWSDIDSHRYKTLYVPDENEHIFRDLPSLPDVSACLGSELCTVQRFWDHIHDTVSVRGSHTNSKIGPLAPVIESGRARSAQLAAWLWSLTRGAGMQAYLASAQPMGALSPGLDRPMHGVFTDLVVHVPPQGDIETPLWLDLSCASCAVGQLPKWSHHRPARVITRVEQDLREKVEVEHEMKVTRGGVLPPGERRITWTIEPSDDPERWRWRRVEEATDQLAIYRAQDWAARDTRAWRRRAQNLVRHRFPRGAVTHFEAGRCERRAGRCTWTLEGTMDAPSRSARIVRSLDVFERYDGDDFLQRERQGPIRVRYGGIRIERLILNVPEGYHIAAQPEPRRVTSPAVDFHLEVSSEGRSVVVERRLHRRLGLFPVTLYERIRAPVRAFVAARGEAIVLTRDAAPPAATADADLIPGSGP